MNYLAIRLTQRRGALDLSIYALSRVSRVGVATISEIESGKNMSPGLFTLVALARALDCSLDYLAGRTTDPRIRKPLSRKVRRLGKIVAKPSGGES